MFNSICGCRKPKQQVPAPNSFVSDALFYFLFWKPLALPLTNRRKMCCTAQNRTIINILCCGFLYLIPRSVPLLNAFRLALFANCFNRDACCRTKERKSGIQIIQILFYSALIRESATASVISPVEAGFRALIPASWGEIRAHASSLFWFFEFFPATSLYSCNRHFSLNKDIIISLFHTFINRVLYSSYSIINLLFKEYLK